MHQVNNVYTDIKLISICNCIKTKTPKTLIGGVVGGFGSKIMIVTAIWVLVGKEDRGTKPEYKILEKWTDTLLKWYIPPLLHPFIIFGGLLG